MEAEEVLGWRARRGAGHHVVRQREAKPIPPIMKALSFWLEGLGIRGICASSAFNSCRHITSGRSRCAHSRSCAARAVWR